jgi:tRNA (mo5U34)-methyltransferase
MIDFTPFFQHIEKTALKRHSQNLKQALELRLDARTHGDLETWQKAIDALPALNDVNALLNQDTVTLETRTAIDSKALSKALMHLHPWRKGPFQLFDIFIDTEWRSDWKWQRIAPHLSDLSNKNVLDVGCGSGYHAWRMRGSGAKFVLGIDPSPKFLLQFQVFKHYLAEETVYFLPLMSEDLPEHMQCFDTVFSMGVL